jgi:hypothetical protein
MYRWEWLWCFPGITQLDPATPASGSDLPINIRPGFLCTDEASDLVGVPGFNDEDRLLIKA